MNGTILKQAALIILKQQEKIAVLNEDLKSKSEEISKAEKIKKVEKILDIISQKKSLTSSERENKKNELLKKNNSELESFLQALGETDVYSEKLGNLDSSKPGFSVSNSSGRKELDDFDRWLLQGDDNSND